MTVHRQTTIVAPLTTTCDDFVRELYAAHGTLLLRYAARLLNGDWHRAEDILQEATLRAWKHATTLNMHAQDARPWMFTVIRNLVTDHHRSRAIRPLEQAATHTTEPTSPDPTDQLLTSQTVIHALTHLTPEHRDIIKHTYFLGYTLTQTAEKLSIPVGTAKSRSHYALRALRDILRQHDVTL